MLGASGVAAAGGTETVVLLHGLGRTSGSMRALARGLRREGFRVVNLGYASRTRPLESLATEWLPAELAKQDCIAAPAAPGTFPAHDGDVARRMRRSRQIPSTALGSTGDPAGPAIAALPRMHLVTHSMGGIIVRLWLRERGVPANLGRVVMIAPPNQGSEVSDRLQGYALFRWFTGVNGSRLGTAAGALPRQLGPWSAVQSELGVIAGEISLNPLFGSWVQRPNDGKVSVAATHLAGERDHVVLRYSHTWIPQRRETIAHVIGFLRQGRFPRAGAI